MALFKSANNQLIMDLYTSLDIKDDVFEKAPLLVKFLGVFGIVLSLV